MCVKSTKKTPQVNGNIFPLCFLNNGATFRFNCQKIAVSRPLLLSVINFFPAILLFCACKNCHFKTFVICHKFISAILLFSACLACISLNYGCWWFVGELYSRRSLLNVLTCSGWGDYLPFLSHKSGRSCHLSFEHVKKKNRVARWVQSEMRWV